MDILDDWFVNTQEDLVESKLSMVRFLNKDMAHMLQLKEKMSDPETVFLIDSMIQSFREYVQVLGESIALNRRLIRERKERGKLSDNLVNRDEGRVRGQTGKGRADLFQHSVA